MTYEQFLKYPVWTWNESRDGYVPVLQTSPLPDDEDTLFMLSTFVRENGLCLPGYVVGIDSFYAFGVFVDGKSYRFNVRLPSEAAATKQALADQLELPVSEVFPLAFRSEFGFLDSPPISGSLPV